jgi:tetratricopeptide (TPR) repeat protein
VLIALAVVSPAVRADVEADADRAFDAAIKRAAAGDPTAIDAFETIATGPATRWSDDAWSEVARLAERAGDYDRARRAHERVIDVNADDALVRRSRATLRRLAAATTRGQWDAVKRDHERLATAIFGGGDPRSALEELEQLARANPNYPRATNLWLVLARGWEMEGDGSRALALLREQIDALARPHDTAGRDGAASLDHDGVAGRMARIGRHRDRERLGLAFARLAIRRGELADANAELDRLTAKPGADQVAISSVRAQLETAELRRWIRRGVWLVLALLLAGAVALLRREAGSWKATVRKLARPPSEVVFLLPVGAVLVAVAQTGNPVVARALLWITIAGVVVAWLTGTTLEAHRARAGRLAARRVVLQAVLAIGAVAASAYLAIDRDRLLDLVEETIEHGPAPR